MDFQGFALFSKDLTRPGARMSAALWSPEKPCAAGLDPLKNHLLRDGMQEASKIRFLEAWMLAGLEGLEEVTEVTEVGGC